MPVVKGRVVDNRGRPAAGAVVYVVEASAPVPDIALKADSDGRFELAVPAGRVVIGARHDTLGTGEGDIELGEGGSAELVIVVTPTER
jgi:hypothetical protein